MQNQVLEAHNHVFRALRKCSADAEAANMLLRRAADVPHQSDGCQQPGTPGQCNAAQLPGVEQDSCTEAGQQPVGAVTRQHLHSSPADVSKQNIRQEPHGPATVGFRDRACVTRAKRDRAACDSDDEEEAGKDNFWQCSCL